MTTTTGISRPKSMAPMRALFVFFAFALACSAPAHALNLTLAAFPSEVQAGESFDIVLLVTNDAADAVQYAVPPRIDLIVATGEGDRIVSFQRQPDLEASIEIPAVGFIRVRYGGSMPKDLVGDVTLRPATLPANAVSIRSLSAGSASAEAARISSALSPYQPIYFSVGSRGNTTARFQISMKFRAFNPDAAPKALGKLYLAYTQTSLWDLSATSKPFLDSSYRPSIFFLDENISQWPFAGSRLGLQGGLEHESNGKGGTDSRSINTLFARPALTFPLGNDYALTLAPKIIYYLDKSENPNVDNYRGYVDFLMRLGEEDGLLIDTLLRHGSDGGSVQVDASYPLRKPTFGNLGGYLHLQYFNGYGESLLNYDQRQRAQFRIGLMVTRGMRW